VTGLIEYLKATAPNLILGPELQRRPPNNWDIAAKKRGATIVDELDERYSNFREVTGRDQYTSRGTQITEQTPDAFCRVEGRYLQYFLQEIPMLCGFVDLALAKEGKQNLWPPLASVHAVRCSRRLQQTIKGDRTLNDVAVTVLPNFDVVVEAPTWPDRELDQLMPYCIMVKEDSLCHLLRLDRKQVLSTVAAVSNAPPLKQRLEQLVTKPLPANVATEIDAWCGHAQKLTIFEDVALVELRGGEPNQVRQELGALVLDAQSENFVVTKDEEKTISVLEQRQRVPRVVQHAPDRFGDCDGVFAKRATRTKVSPKAPTRKKVQLERADLVGYTSTSTEFLNALEKAIGDKGCECWHFKQDGLLVVDAAELPEVRTILKRLGEQYDVELK
jgi:hypothetical protein